MPGGGDKSTFRLIWIVWRSSSPASRDIDQAAAGMRRLGFHVVIDRLLGIEIDNFHFVADRIGEMSGEWR